MMCVQAEKRMEIDYPNLQPFYKKVFDKTISDHFIATELKFVDQFFEEWAGNFVNPFGKDLYRNGKLVSIMYSYVASQSLVFDWLAHTLIFGHYQNVFREIRTILENLFFMYTLDVKFQKKTVDEKYKILEKLEKQGKEPHGKPVFERSMYGDWKKSYGFYKHLCKYVHIHTSTSGLMALKDARDGFPETLSVDYDRNAFLKCVDAWRKLARISVALAVDLCRKLNVEIAELNPNYLLKKW